MTKREEVDIDGYPTRPRDISKSAWFYEQVEGLVVVQHQEGGSPITTTIPWRLVEKAVDHHRAARSKKRRAA